MKLNNKGFAITAVLYGLLILFVVLVSSYLLVVAAKKDRVDLLTSEIESSYREETIRYEISLIDQDGNITYPLPRYIMKNGKVTIEIDSNYSVTGIEGATYIINGNEIILSLPSGNVRVYYELEEE